MNSEVAGEERWFEFSGAASGDGLSLTWRDVSDRVADRRVLEDSRRRLAAQAEELRRLAASPLRIGPGIVAVPLSGRIDAPRLAAAQAAIERESGRGRVATVVFDVTGVEALDAEAAAAIRRTSAALGLQGIAARVAGVRAELARALVLAGVDLGGLSFHASLADALALGTGLKGQG